MKKTIHIIGVAVFVLCLSLTLSGCFQQTDETTTTETTTEPDIVSHNVYGELAKERPIKEGFITYTNEEDGIIIDHPEDWTIKEDVMGTTVMFLSPQEDTSDTFQENINVLVQDLAAQPITLKEYTEISVNQIEQLITDAKIEKSEQTIFRDGPAHKIIYSGKQGQLNLKWMQVWAVMYDNAYVVTYTAEADKFDEYLDTAETITKSFGIK